MTEIYTTGTWTPRPGQEDEFVSAWSEFATWASGMPGAGQLLLTRDMRDTGRFVSIGGWATVEQVRDWKGSPEFRERMARVLQHVADFKPSELAVVATAAEGITNSIA